MGDYSLLGEHPEGSFSARREKMFKKRYGVGRRQSLFAGLGSVAWRIGAHGHGKRARRMMVPA
ncbi:MAG: hypothetical protein AAGD34_12035 [Pseudomonadota bacterium]